MDFKNRVHVLFVLLCTILVAICYGRSDEFHSSRATYDGNSGRSESSDACGFGEYGKTVNDGQVTGVSRLFWGGAGCGACYQVKCSLPNLCSNDGTKVVVTDYGEGNRTDFILSSSAFANLALPNMAEKLIPFGAVDVQFKRIPCQYNNNNLVFKIHSRSQYPRHLAIVPLYQPGAYEITAVQVSQGYSKQWKPMRRAYGAVFDIMDPPRGNALTLRFQTSEFGYENSDSWVQLNNLIPAGWRVGNSYDTGIST